MQSQREQNDNTESVDSFLCPSFSAYSSNQLADIADQVTHDHLRSLNDNNFVDDHRHRQNDNDFEFVTFQKAADEVFFDGRQEQVFPIFNRDLVDTACQSGRSSTVNAEEDATALGLSMGKLLIGGDEDRRDPPSSSSSEVDDLEAIPEGTYCVWTPNPVQASPNRCSKSKSTGSSSSKRWKLLDLLRRSNSDGKDSFVFLTPSSGRDLMKKKGAKAENSKDAGKPKAKVAGSGAGGGEKKVTAHEALYVRNREMRRVDKRKSYLPYRQDLVGFFATVNGMSRTFPTI